eukprot:364976-Chlamydomonas_euryale.AAC.8
MVGPPHSQGAPFGRQGVRQTTTPPPFLALASPACTTGRYARPNDLPAESTFSCLDAARSAGRRRCAAFRRPGRARAQGPAPSPEASQGVRGRGHAPEP